VDQSWDCSRDTLNLIWRGRFSRVTDIPYQRPPRLNDHLFYTQTRKIAPFIMWWGEVGRSRNHLICRMQGLDNSYSCTEDFVYIDQLPIWAVRYQAIQGQTVDYD
jgi:hypothetical protein